MWERPFRVIQEKRLNKEEIKTSIKKIPAVLLLAILCLTAFHVSVFAAETAEVRIPVRVELAGGKPSPEETYTVVLQAMGEAPMPSESTMEITGDGRASAIQNLACIAIPLCSSRESTKRDIMIMRSIM